MQHWVCDCGKQMPTKLAACPHCGQQQPAPPRPAQEQAEPSAYALLVKRYRAGYQIAKLVGAAGYLGAGLGVLFALAGFGRRAGVVLLVGGVGLFVAGVALRASATALSTLLDRTCFAAPGFNAKDRIRLAFEAEGGSRTGGSV